MNRALPSGLTSYDLVKTFAIVTMIIDHIGYYFFPEDMWWRAVGRMSAPVWFFLIGYAQTREISPKLWIGFALLIFASGALGAGILPANILINMIFIRLVIDNFARRAVGSFSNFLEFTAIIVVLGLPTAFLTDYGLVGLGVAMYGLVLRRVQEGQPVFKDALGFSGIFAFAVFYALCLVSFEFNDVQKAVVFVVTGAVFWLLQFFKSREYPALASRLSGAGAAAIQFCGRYTLEIYVAHLVILKIIALALGYEAYKFWSWNIFSVG